MIRPALGLLYVAALLGCAWWQGRGRLVTDPCVRVGLRPAASLEGAAVTVLVEGDPLVCHVVHPETRP